MVESEGEDETVEEAERAGDAGVVGLELYEGLLRPLEPEGTALKPWLETTPSL